MDCLFISLFYSIITGTRCGVDIRWLHLFFYSPGLEIRLHMNAWLLRVMLTNAHTHTRQYGEMASNERFVSQERDCKYVFVRF